MESWTQGGGGWRVGRRGGKGGELDVGEGRVESWT